MKTTLLLLVLSAFFQVAYTQGFNTVYSPDGIYVFAAGNQGSIFRSADGGASYASYTINNTVNYLSCFAFDSTVWFGGSNGSVYRTSKYFMNPSAYATGSPYPVNSVYFLNKRLGFICGDSGAVMRTTNGGFNWSPLNTGTAAVKYNSIYFLDSLNGALAGNNGYIYITSNGGASWTIQTSGTARNLLKIKYFQGGIVSAGEYGTFVIKDDTAAFKSVNMRIDSDIRGLAGNSIGKVHLCGGGGFIRNNSNGSKAFLNFEINPMVADLKDICYTDSLTGFAVSSLNQAVIKTTNGGANWQLSPGTTVTFAWSTKMSTSGGIGNNLCRHPYDRNTLFCMFGNRVYVSRNRGDNWSQISTTSLGTNAHDFFVSPVDTNIWLCAIESSPDKVIRSTDYGTTWSTVLSINFSNYGTPLEIDQNNPSVFYYAPDGGGFYKSTDNGATFTEISGNYPFRSPCDVMVMPDSSNVIFIADGVTGSGLGDIFKTVNGGVNWTKVQTNTSSSEIPALCNSVFDRSTMFATNWSGGDIYRTTNFGDNWSLLRTNSASGWAADICREDPTLIITGSYGSSTFLSTDRGATFTTISISGGAGAGEIAVDRGYVIDMRTGAIMKLTANYTVVTKTSENLISTVPSDFKLYQNYPNPFNPSTIVKFDLPESGLTTVKIFDVLGREVISLLNEHRNAGTHEIVFNASGLSSGVYFCRIDFGGRTDIKKLTLIK
ncbi:MAG: YCF48-related protein [Bacteroidetes bacterium]|nr:YCF48-related protein [Bacteroidota bacterium]